MQIVTKKLLFLAETYEVELICYSRFYFSVARLYFEEEIKKFTKK
jgi:hypothetical protein